MAIIIPFPQAGAPACTVEDALRQAQAKGLSRVLILGDTGEHEFVLVGGDLPRKDALWMLECARNNVVTGE